MNHSRGYFQLQDARLLRRNGDPTSLLVASLMVNQDDITFIGQATAQQRPAPAAEADTEAGAGAGEDEAGATAVTPQIDALFGERSLVEKAPRRFLVLTPGHAIVGSMHVHREMTVANFVEATDPRFIPFTGVAVRSLSDPPVISQFAFLLVNRTQMNAVAEVGDADDVAEAIAEVERG